MDTPLPILGPVLLATLTPGPSMLLAMDHGLRFGVRRTVPTALGNVVATVVQAALSMAALWLVAKGAGELLRAVGWLGAVYLAGLGLRMILGEAVPGAGARVTGAEGTGLKRFRQAFFVTLLNPAAYLFFTAVFPPFLGTKTLLLVALVLPTLGITFACMLLYARFGQEVTRFLGAPGRTLIFRRILGAAFLGLAVWMILGR